MDALITALVQANFPPERIIPRAPMSRYCTFRIGGEADVLVNISGAQEASLALQAARHAGMPVTVIGNGSNLIVRDGGIHGLVIRVAGDCAQIHCEDHTLRVGAGALLSSVAQFALSHGLDGMAEISGIPGTIGGGALMNAGAYGGELSQIITRVDGVALSNGKPVFFEGPNLGFSYRHSAMMDAGIIITEVTLALRPGDPEDIRARMDACAQARRSKQPLNYPSAGSVFKRPAGQFAGKLIDECGLRGLRVGDAQVSEKHAGFIVNLGHATASDVLALMDRVRDTVHKQSGVLLEPEVRILGTSSEH